MMSLTEISLGTVVKKQYIFKLRSYANLYVSLVITQLIALLFTIGGMVIENRGIGWNNIFLEVKFYSSLGIFIFTVFWILIYSFILPFPSYRYPDFSFVTNRVSSNMANMGFLITAAIAGGVTVTLGSLLVRNIIYYIGGNEGILSSNFWVSGGDLFTSMAVGSLYLLLLGTIGYFLGILVQLHRSLYLILPAFILGLLIYAIYAARTNPGLVSQPILFFVQEEAPVLFILKIIGSVLLLWLGATILSNRVELR